MGALYPEVTLPRMGSTPDLERQFEITLLKKRVENLEAIVFELLRGRVHHGSVAAYQGRLSNLGFGGSTEMFGQEGKRLAWEMQQAWPPENLNWPVPDKTKGEE